MSNVENANVTSNSESTVLDITKDENGTTAYIIKEGCLQSYPADIRYKVRKDVNKILRETLPTFNEIVKSQKEGYVVINDVPYKIEDYAGPDFMQDILNASLAYWDEAALKTMDPIVHVKSLGIKGLDDQQILNPIEFRDKWESLNSARHKFNCVQFKRSRSIYANYKALISADGNGSVFVNDSGTIPEEAVTLVDARTIIPVNYVKSASKLSDLEVVKWVKDRIINSNQNTGQ